MAFNPDEYLKKTSFDPDAYLSKSSEPPAAQGPQTGAGEAALEHYGNTMLAGYLPHVQAAVERLTPDPGAGVDADLRAKGFKIDQPEDTYLSERDRNIKRLDTEGREHPIASKVGTAAGIVNSMVLPAGAVAKEASLGAKMLHGAKVGAAYGAAANPGDIEGEYGGLQVGGRAKNAAIGAGIGAAAPVLLTGASKATEKVQSYLKKKAEKLAENSTGATGKEAQSFVPGTGRQLLDRKIVKFGSSPKGISERAESAIDTAEARKDAILGDELPGVTVDRNTIYNRIRDKIKGLRGDESQLDLSRKLEGKLDDVLGAADQSAIELPLPQSEKIRKGFDRASKWDSAADSATRDANKEMAGAYREAAEEAATAANPELGAQYKDAKATQQLLIPVRNAAARRTAVTQQSPHGGLMDAAYAGVGHAAAGGVGAVAGLGVKGLRPRLSSSAAVSADVASKIAGRLRGGLGAVNPNVASTVAARAARGEPGMQRDHDPVLNDPRMMQLFQSDPSLIDRIEDPGTQAKVRAKLKTMGRAPAAH